jgi:hypothetical protein
LIDGILFYVLQENLSLKYEEGWNTNLYELYYSLSIFSMINLKAQVFGISSDTKDLKITILIKIYSISFLKLYDTSNPFSFAAFILYSIYGFTTYDTILELYFNK